MARPHLGSVVSLFSGCGGSDLGVTTVGFEVIWANEINGPACHFYQAVTGQMNIINDDIRRIDKFPKADLLIGCYPCQGYSQGGLRNPNANINLLYREFDRALRQIKPRAFIVENVDGMRFSHNQKLLNNQLTRFRLAGYRLTWQVLNAADFGLPQTRQRLFIVGIRTRERKTFKFPVPTHGQTGLPAIRTQRDAIWHLRDKSEGNCNVEPFHWYYLSRNRRRPWDSPASTIVARDRHVSLHPDSPPLVRLGPDSWAFTDDPSKARRLSYLECAVLQGFPDPWVFKMQSLSIRHRVIGNAVPPPLFEKVAASLCEVLKLYL